MAVLVEFVVFLFELFCLLAELFCLLEEFQECSLSVIGLSEFSFEFFAHLLVHLVVIIELVEIVHELLVALDREVLLHFLHVLYFFFVARQLLLHLGHHLVAGLISLLDIVVSAMELFRLILHISFQLRLSRLKIILGFESYLVDALSHLGEKVHVGFVF